MKAVEIWEEQVLIPTYETGKEEKAPIFLEKRVYQGSSGKVYPYPSIETIEDEKKEKAYTVVYLENEYLKIMVLPELGGRILRAYDKTNDYDFVYYNHVIKPALVGLTGPWISGGIEFNWPQHHRPTTFRPVDYMAEEAEDGSKSVLLHDVDQLYGTKGIAKYTLYPGKAYLEVTGQLYNRTSLPQTFLWWANPAVPANEQTQSIFPPDIHAVMDHGKRDVSRFPIATGVYYKQDYSAGVDISRYKNISVPTSYMAEKSKYDFVGGYDHAKEAGILHIADHHISPGKKQWTWGCGDFGKAWDRNLTDEDGPYVELMAGVYTDNQPDFSWLKPFEEKVFHQYFMPYKAAGQVKNATVEAVIHLSYDGEEAQVIVYATGVYENARIVLKASGKTILDEAACLSPVDIYRAKATCPKIAEEMLSLAVYAGGRCLVEYHSEAEKISKLPELAKAAEEPERIMTNEELYLAGQHMEQYRHASCLPDPYYMEGLKRDPGDIRINTAVGSLWMRRGRFEKGEAYFRKALERMTERNPNPYNSEAFYMLGLALWYQGKESGAYEAFFKAAWSSEQQEMSFYYLAAIDAKNGRVPKALAHIEQALIKNAHHIKARGLKAYLLRMLSKRSEALEWAAESLALDPFDFVSGYEQALLQEDSAALRAALNKKMRNYEENYLMAARDYAEMGAYQEAVALISECSKEYPMLRYYEAYYRSRLGENVGALLKKAEKCNRDYCFPNKLEDIAVLEFAISCGCTARAPYYLGCLHYDKLQWEKAIELWEASAEAEPDFPTVHRNLSLAYYNKKRDADRAKIEMEKAFCLNTEDARIFLELDQLYKKLGWSFEKRLENYEAYGRMIASRDDLYIEYITLLNMCKDHKKAYDCIMNHKFHPWEGGEGKVTAQYKLALFGMAFKAERQGCYGASEEMLKKALYYPDHVGEGRLAGTKDNDIYYHLGLALEAQGKKEAAEECYHNAKIGTGEPAGGKYYNDQPADMILYQGLAYEKLGMAAEARSCFYRLIDYGERHLDEPVKTEYFAVSLPDFLIFDENDALKNQAHCYYVMALGNIGLKSHDKAKTFLEQAIHLEPSHMMCRVYQQRLESWLEA